jgi:ligand-binding SRPBCC domain-containing protein
MTEFRLTRELWLPKRRSEVFPFFADAHNLEAITPPWLRFRVLTPAPIAMRPGVRIDYRLSLHGIPFHWQSEITAWEPPFRFTDEQRRGPYRFWIHDHEFLEQDGGTLCIDRVRYAVWGGALINRFFVRSDVARIFTYRSKALAQRFDIDGTPRR